MQGTTLLSTLMESSMDIPSGMVVLVMCSLKGTTMAGRILYCDLSSQKRFMIQASMSVTVKYVMLTFRITQIVK